MPVGLSDEFGDDALKKSQWKGFGSRNKLETPALIKVVSQLRAFWQSLSLSAAPDQLLDSSQGNLDRKEAAPQVMHGNSKRG